MDVYVFPVDSPIDVSCTFIVKYLWAHHTNSARNLGSNIQTPEVMRYILVKLLLLSFFIYLLDTHKYFLLRDTYSFIHSTNQIIYFFCRCVLFFCSRYLQHWLLDCYCHFSFWLLSLQQSFWWFSLFKKLLSLTRSCVCSFAFMPRLLMLKTTAYIDILKWFPCVITMEMQIKIMMRYEHTPVRMVTRPKVKSQECWKCAGEGDPLWLVK